MSEARVAEVLLDQNLEKPLDYEIPETFRASIQVGSRVEVYVRNSLRKGTIATLKKASQFAKLRPLHRLITQTTLSDPLWQLAHWMSRYYCTSLQRTMKCFTPPNVRREIKPKTRLTVKLATTRELALELCKKLQSKQSAQASVLEKILNAEKPPFLSALLEELEISRSPIDSLVKKKALQLEEIVDDALEDADFFPSPPKTLNAEQATCLKDIGESLQSGTFKTHLLFGVTGSGKTEVYLQAIQQVLDLGKSALLLVPEIALTSQTIERFRARFGIKLAVLHHRKSLGERSAAWESLKKGETKIAIGARSAIFCPAQDLGLIIIDEEHDSSYKQNEEMPTYHARDIAVMRGKLEKAVVLLGSATPSLDSYHNAINGKYRLNILTSRATKASQPTMRIIDMKSALDKAGGFSHFSPDLLDAIKEKTKKGEQTLLLLNKRGYRRMQICSECRYIAKCPHCDLSLTYHKGPNTLRCHLCDYQTHLLRQCPSCQSSSQMEFRGFGTEHVEKSLCAIFPDVRTLRMDRDTTQKKNSHEEMFKQFRAHKADVLIGTQMIAKGFHFPSVTLVGILNADAALQIPDFRSSESLFQLIAQASGRAGRSELKGEVILQTFLPQHPLLHLAATQDYQAFHTREIDERRLFSFPPFCRLAKVVFSGPDENETLEAITQFRTALVSAALPNTEILPALPAGHPKIKDRYRFQFLTKTGNIMPLSDCLTTLRSRAPTSRKIHILIDIDPTSTFF